MARPQTESEAALRPISRSRSHCQVFSRSLHLDLSVSTVLVFVRGIVTKQVLRPQLSGDGRERLWQRSNCVGPIELTTGSIGEIVQITVGQQIKIIQHAADRIVLWRRGRIAGL